MNKNKFYLSTVILLIICNSMLFGQLRVGYGLSSDYTWSVLGVDTDTEVDGGLVLGYDHLLKNKGNTQFGIGGEFMLNRKFSDADDDSGIAFHSIYGYGKYLVNESFYGFGKLGYNVHTWSSDDDPDLKGGLTFGGGGGYALNEKIAFEGIYSSHSGEFTGEGNPFSFDVKYTCITIGLVYSF